MSVSHSYPVCETSINEILTGPSYTVIHLSRIYSVHSEITSVEIKLTSQYRIPN